MKNPALLHGCLYPFSEANSKANLRNRRRQDGTTTGKAIT
jgi:hypothetical protein